MYVWCQELRGQGMDQGNKYSPLGRASCERRHAMLWMVVGIIQDLIMPRLA